MATIICPLPPESTEVQVEQFRRESQAKTKLLEAGIDVAHVYGSWYAAESDTQVPHKGDMRWADIVIYLDSADVPKTALLVEQRIILMKGWGPSPRP